MSRVRLTAGRIKQFECPADKAQAFLWDSDAPGLAVRATPSGAKSFVFQGRAGGPEFRLTIGSIQVWSVDAAQVEARRLQSLCDQGIDPRKEKAARIEQDAEERREETRQRMTLGDVWPRYIKEGQSRWSAHHLRDHQRLADLGGAISKKTGEITKPGPIAGLWNIRLVDITQERLEQWINSENYRPARIALAFRLVRAFINWAAEDKDISGLIQEDAHKAKKVRLAVPARKAKRDCLMKEQLPAWFSAVKGLEYQAASAFLQAVLLTGARHTEMAAIKWDDVDMRWDVLTLRDKVEGDRQIPLTPYVKHLLKGLPRTSQFVFASERSKSGYIGDPRTSHNIALDKAGLPPLSIHGLRRSFGTLSEWVDVPVGVVAQIMGHKPSATAEKHYRQRPMDLLRKWHVEIENWILGQAGIPPACP